MVRWLLLGFAVVILNTSAAADPPPERGLAGTYVGSGTDIQGGEYQVTVTIEKEKDAYNLKWESPNGQNWIGVGIHTGDKLSVSWAGKTAKGIMVGVMVYEIRKDGTLAGTWTILGAKGVVRTETLTPDR